jgi:hypothetical protein
MDYESLRRKFKPSTVSALFVGESRPAGGKFFYAANSNLFSATRDGFAVAYAECPDGTAFLEFFQARGCYLDDLCEEPVNKGLSREEREREHENGILPLAERLMAYDPNAVVIVMLSIVSPVCRGLQEVTRRTQRSPVPIYPLPFPRPEHRARYVHQLAAVVTKLRAARVLDPA